MKYYQLSKSSKINRDINEYFKFISEIDRRKFCKKFREQPDDKSQVMHTLRELILGAYLASRGFNVEYDRKIDGKTPDWVILDQKTPEGIVELLNFHLDRYTEIDIEKQLNTAQAFSILETALGSVRSAIYWQPRNKERLYQRIQEKSGKYAQLVEQNNLAYVVSIFGELKAAVKVEELCECLFKDHGGLFIQFPTLSGLLFFRESSGEYAFEFIRNPHGTVGKDIADRLMNL